MVLKDIVGEEVLHQSGDAVDGCCVDRGL